ncbi:reverse transcriptase domain-containing protein [Tanacetum coccineum]
MIGQGVADGLAARDADRSMNGDDSHNSGTGVRRQVPLAHECTYPDLMKCKPLYFKGTEGVIELTQWFERMETVFRISNCTAKNQIKFATCTLLGSALTWWNAHVRTVGHDIAYAMTWTNLKKMMTDKYCPRGEIKKLEVKMWNLKFKVESRSWIPQLVSEPRGSRSRVDKIEGRDVFGTRFVHRSVVTGRSVVLSSVCANVSEGRTEEATDIRMALVLMVALVHSRTIAIIPMVQYLIPTGIPSSLVLLSPDLGFHNNQRFQELALMCAKMFPEESDKIEKYVGGLPDMIHGSVMASKPKTMEDAIKFATELMDKKINTLTERQAENKRKLDKNNQAQ